MIDNFMEESAVKKNHLVEDVMYLLSWVFMVLTALVALFELNVSLRLALSGQGLPVEDLILGLVSGGLAVYIFFFKDRLKVEYDYTFTSGALDFAQVFNRSKRKSLGSLNVRTVDAFGAVNSEAFQRFLTMPNVKTNRWFVNRGSELYYFYFQKDDNKRMIVFEPSQEMVNMIKQYLPAGAFRQ